MTFLKEDRLRFALSFSFPHNGSGINKPIPTSGRLLFVLSFSEFFILALNRVCPKSPLGRKSFFIFLFACAQVFFVAYCPC